MISTLWADTIAFKYTATGEINGTQLEHSGCSKRHWHIFPATNKYE